MRCRQSADPSPDDDQVIHFAGVDWLAGLLPECSIAKAMCDLERSRMAATQPGGDWWVVSGSTLRFAFSVGGKERTTRSQASSDRHRRAVHKVAASNRTIHP